MELLIDAGNTRLKWALARAGALGQYGASVHRGRPLDEALAPLAALDARPTRAFLAAVAQSALTARLHELVRARFGIELEPAVVRSEAFGLRIAYAHPERLGVDRWLAMLAARALCAGAVLVAGLGTAATVDAVDAGGVHLGGLIVPGLATMKRALLEATARIRDAGDDEPVAALFAADTGAAVSAGAVHAIAALIERGYRELERSAAGPVSLILTGGDAPRVASRVAVATSRIEPDLVLRGLLVYAGP